MKCAAIGALMVAIVAVTSCDRKEVGETRSKNDGPFDPLKLSPTELDELTSSFYLKTPEDSSFLTSPEYLAVEAAHGPAFKKLLIATIRDATSITIEEHSDESDFPGPEQDWSRRSPRFVYEAVKLTDEQKTSFLRAAEAMDSETVSLTPACFSPHHRMEFLQQNGQRSALSICFQCGKAPWSNVDLFHPEGLFDVLEDVVNGAGLKTERDWRSLAKQRSEQETGAPTVSDRESE
jgi:hypothetical protein